MRRRSILSISEPSQAVNERLLSLTPLYSSHSAVWLDELRERLHYVDLSPLVDEWLESLRGRLTADTVQHYQHHVRSLIPQGMRFPRSELTFERLAAWLSRIDR